MIRDDLGDDQCKKMQKNCKKMQIYLHISKKSSIFATDFNSGVHNDQNQTRVMNDVCVFRCQCEGEMYRVLVISNPKVEHGMYYVIYKGRKQATPIRFQTEGDAVQRCVQMCCMEHCEMKGRR